MRIEAKYSHLNGEEFLLASANCGPVVEGPPRVISPRPASISVNVWETEAAGNLPHGVTCEGRVRCLAHSPNSS